MPSWEIDIGGTAEVRRATPVFTDPVFRKRPIHRPGSEESWLLELRCLASAGGVVEDFVADQIVPFGAIPPAFAGDAVIPVDVNHPAAARAVEFLREQGNAEPSLYHRLVVEGLYGFVVGRRRKRVKPLTGTAGGDQVQVSFEASLGRVVFEVP